jgi:hypothetical protein
MRVPMREWRDAAPVRQCDRLAADLPADDLRDRATEYSADRGPDTTAPRNIVLPPSSGL